MSLLPDVDEKLKKQIAQKAVTAICTKGRTTATLFLTSAMIENARLLAEVNRLRALVGEEPLPSFQP